MNGMTCKEFDEVVHGFVRMELLDMNVREAALDHTAHCASCADRLAQAAVLAEASEAACGNLREQQTPARVEAVVLAAFRNHHRRATWRRSFEWAAVGAVAATVLALVWTFAGPTREQSTPSPKKDVSSRSSGPVDAHANVPAQPAISTSAADPGVVSAGTGDTLAAEDFVQLPYADAIGPEDLGMVVRVQLTRASLTELGYPATDSLNPEDDLVSADVLVGEDGWPRAVKVIQ
jgi:hypothetical protein